MKKCIIGECGLKPFSGAEPMRLDRASVVEVICIKTARGCGTVSDPVRSVYEFWTKNARKIATIDAELID